MGAQGTCVAPRLQHNMTQPGSTGDTGYTSGKGAMKAPSRAELDQKVDDKTTVMEGSELAGLSVGVRTALNTMQTRPQ